LALLSDADFELPEGSVRGALVHRADVSAAYLAGRAQDRRDAGPHLAQAPRRARQGDADGAGRGLSTRIAEPPTRGAALRRVGSRLLDRKQRALAARLFRQVQRQRPFEPHSYRDLARGLEDGGRYGLAAVQYEVVLAGTWHARFGDALRLVVQEEYAA